MNQTQQMDARDRAVFLFQQTIEKLCKAAKLDFVFLVGVSDANSVNHAQGMEGRTIALLEMVSQATKKLEAKLESDLLQGMPKPLQDLVNASKQRIERHHQKQANSDYPEFNMN